MSETSSHANNQLAHPEQAQPGRSRVGALWISLVGFVIILIVLVVFILQNMQKVRITFLGFKGEVPLALGLLIAAIAGALLIIIIGSIRIIQLRHRANQTSTKPTRELALSSDEI